jgi:hypothetical protein
METKAPSLKAAKRAAKRAGSAVVVVAPTVPAVPVGSLPLSLRTATDRPTDAIARAEAEATVATNSGPTVAPSPADPLAEFGPAVVSVPRSRSAGVARSWEDSVVRAKRTTRNGVEAREGSSGPFRKYDSLRKAFRALGLPDEKHIPFRIGLKEKGSAVYVDKRATPARSYEFNVLYD